MFSQSGASPEPKETSLDGLRIALINWRDPWQDVAGGAEEYAWQVSRQLHRRGAHVHYVTSRQRGQARTERREGITISRMGGTFSRYPLVLGWMLAHRRRFDVVIDCMNGIPFFSPLVMPRRVPVICVVHHVHDQQFFVHFPTWLASIGKLLEGPVARRVYRRHVVAAVSPSTVTAMRDRLRWTGRIHVIPNGTPVAPAGIMGAGGSERTADGERTAGTAGFTADEIGSPAIVCVGRLSAHKRVERVVELADRLRHRWPRLKVHIVGRGAAYGPLQAQVEALGLEDHVRLHGFMEFADKNALLAAATLHVSASQFEGWGLSVMEAASLGVPTVAYDVDGLRDAVNDGVTGWLVTGGEQLVDVVDRSLKEMSDPVRAAEVRAACRAWAGCFTWAASGERMARLLRAELSTPRAERRRRTAGRADVVRYRHNGEEWSELVQDTDPQRLAEHAARPRCRGGGDQARHGNGTAPRVCAGRRAGRREGRFPKHRWKRFRRRRRRRG